MRIDGRVNLDEPGMTVRSLKKTGAGVLTISPHRPNDLYKFPKNKKRPFGLEDDMNDGRVSTEELGNAIKELMRHMPPISEQEIALVKMNPSLSFIQKALITRKMKRIIRKCHKSKNQ